MKIFKTNRINSKKFDELRKQGFMVVLTGDSKIKPRKIDHKIIKPVNLELKELAKIVTSVYRNGFIK